VLRGFHVTGVQTCLFRSSLLASVVGAHMFQGTRWTVAREVPESAGNDHPSIAPYGTFRCKDGPIQIGVANQGLWRRFAPVVGLDPDDPRYATIPDRSARPAELTADTEPVLPGIGRAPCSAAGLTSLRH